MDALFANIYIGGYTAEENLSLRPWLSRLSEQFSGSHAASGTTFRVTCGYQKAGISLMKRVTERIFRISNKLQRSMQKHYTQFSLQKAAEI
jgi:hypothetical protein